MRARREHVEVGGESSFFCRRARGRGWPFDWHFHPEYELTLIVHGRGQRFVGDDIAEFRDGDLVLLGGNLPHTWHSSSRMRMPSEAVVVQFAADCFGDQFFDRPETRHIGRLLRQASAGLQFRGRSASAAAQQMLGIADQPPLRRLATLLEILDLLAGCRAACALATPRFRPVSRPSDQRRIHRALQFVHDRLTTPSMSMQDAAAHTHLSRSAFSRFFQRATGKRFARYVNERRVGRACQLLAETDRNIAVIALDCGFGNLSNFNRRFKEVRGVVPRVYRRKFQSDDPAAA